MATSIRVNNQFSRPNTLQLDQRFRFNNLSSRKRSLSVKCQNKVGNNNNYYDLLGVSVDSSHQEIKDAYRKLQKKYHPDIAGEKGHDRTLLLNKAYTVLSKDDLRREYDKSIGRRGVSIGVGDGTVGSIWRGPLRPRALFVDENACVGCRECVHHAGNTFTMDEVHGTAHVKVQYGDDDGRIQTSVDSCPVNCIHYVDTDELEVLEYLIQPQPKEGYGIYGQGWERPKNVFMVAKSFNKDLKRRKQKAYEYEPKTEKETMAQAQAREKAYTELKMGSFSRIWSWMKTMISG